MYERGFSLRFSLLLGIIGGMKIWITRQDLATVVIRGIPNCRVWFNKPIYNPSRRGEEVDRNYPDGAIGWEVVGQKCASVNVGKSFYPFPEFTRAVIREIHRSIGEVVEEGCEIDTWPEALDRWNALWRTVEPNTYDDQNNGATTMCLELDVPWQLWLDFAESIAECDVGHAAWLASLNPAELPF